MTIKNILFVTLLIFIVSLTISNAVAYENTSYSIELNDYYVNDDLLVNNQNTYADLDYKINCHDNFTSLDDDYTYNSNYDGDLSEGISIEREMTIDGKGHTINGNNQACAFKIKSDNVIIKNINFINLKSNVSSSILWEGVNGSIINCNFSDNFNTFGGVICWQGNSGLIDSCNFKNNYAKDFGSAILWKGNWGKVTDSSFVKNNASNKGTLFWRGDNGIIENCLFEGNGDYDYALSQAKIVLDYEWDCHEVNPYSNPMIRNLYFYHAGAIYSDANNILINKCRFLKNSAYDGGAIYALGQFQCINSSFINNSCVNKGGAVYCEQNAVNSSITDSIFVNNSRANNSTIFTQNVTQKEFFRDYNNIIMINNNSYLFICDQIREYESLDLLLIQNHVPFYLLEKLFKSNDIGTFEELAILINYTAEGDILVLNKDYHYINGSNKGILISKPIIIDGQGHTLNGNHLSRMFNVTAENVILKNINFINGNALGRYFSNDAGGGAIYWNGANGVVENCSFMNNTGEGIEDDPFDKEETIITEDGMIIHTISVRPMGAKINEGGAIVWNGTNGTVSNSIFINNNVGYPNIGGAICWRANNGKIVNSEFYQNSAWCGSAIAWVGNDGLILNSIIANNTFFDGGIYWFGHNGTVKNSILLGAGHAGVLRSSFDDLNAEYNFWGDTCENPNQIEKVENLKNWLVIEFSHNGKLIQKGQKILIEYEITKLTDKKGNIVKYNGLINNKGKFNYTATKTGYLNINFTNGKLNINIDSKDKILSRNLTQYYAGKITYKVNIQDVCGKVTGKYVKFTINKKNYNVKIDKNGVAALKVKLKPGRYTVHVSYGDIKVKNKIIIKNTLITKNLSKKVKKTAKFKVKVLNSKGKPFKKHLVKIKFKNKTYKLKTNKKGIAFFKVPKNLKIGKYSIKTISNGLVNTNKIIVKK